RPTPWNGRQLLALYHPGPRALIHRPLAMQRADYERLAALVAGRPEASMRVNEQAPTKQGAFRDPLDPSTNAEREKLSTFLNSLIPKLPASKEDDLSPGILEAIDMDSYRVEVKAALDISLPDENAEVDPVPTSGSAYLAEIDVA
ncbi:MAG TPA: hypothetical protein VGP33_12390, partial [Chloroflexota bacterium]|nr:hypothetical protein [Chloroflexota bacterium]